MANKKVSQLSATTESNDNVYLIMNNSGNTETFRIKRSDLLSGAVPTDVITYTNPSYPTYFTGTTTDEYQDVLDRATALGYTLPSAPSQTKQNNLIYGLKEIGVWQHIGQLLLFDPDTPDGRFGLINMALPSGNLAVTGGTPTFNVASGITLGNGANLKTPYNDTNAQSKTSTADGIFKAVWIDNVVDGTGNYLWDSSNNNWNRLNWDNTTSHSVFDRGVGLNKSVNLKVEGFIGVQAWGNVYYNPLRTFFTNDEIQTAYANSFFNINGSNMYLPGPSLTGTFNANYKMYMTGEPEIYNYYYQMLNLFREYFN